MVNGQNMVRNITVSIKKNNSKLSTKHSTLHYNARQSVRGGNSKDKKGLLIIFIFPSLLFGYVYQYSRNLIVVVLLHALANLFFIVYIRGWG